MEQRFIFQIDEIYEFIRQKAAHLPLLLLRRILAVAFCCILAY